MLLAALLVVYTDRVRVAQIYAHQALHDALTGLPNRALLIDRCTQMLALAKRHEGIVAAFYIDLDGFKRVNVAHGHEGGDAVLIAVGERLLTTVRPSDTVARHIQTMRDMGVGHVLCWMNFGGLAQDKIRRSMELFARDVMPKFR